MMSKQYTIGRAPCVNCGKTWGGHSGIHCWSGTSERRQKTFEPVGYALSDICIHCGDTLENHRDRYVCKSILIRQFEKIHNMFSDRDFEI